MANDSNKNDDVYVEHGELTRLRDPRSGKLKEVDLSLLALSRTMENIRKSAEIINAPDTSFEMAMSRFSYIEELVLDHAQFSPRLQNLQIRIKDQVIEIVKNIEDLEHVRDSFARNHYFTKVHAELAKSSKHDKQDRKRALEKGCEILEKAMRKHLGGDLATDKYLQELQNEMKTLA